MRQLEREIPNFDGHNDGDDDDEKSWSLLQSKRLSCSSTGAHIMEFKGSGVGNYPAELHSPLYLFIYLFECVSRTRTMCENNKKDEEISSFSPHSMSDLVRRQKGEPAAAISFLAGKGWISFPEAIRFMHCKARIMRSNLAVFNSSRNFSTRAGFP